MDEVCKELDEIKDEMKKLTADYHAKKELSESLKKAHSEQLLKIQEAKREFERQTQELNAKQDELSLAKQMYEDLKANLHEKEFILRHLSSANEQLRTSFDGKLQNLETENRKLVASLDEANAKTEEQGQKMNVYKEEIEHLKGLLSVSQKKCLEAEDRAKASRELKQRDDMLMELEQEKREVMDRLKWKDEQFKHLEEAHKKLQDQFQESKKEWESEKSTLLDEVCSLQMKLESQARILDGLRSQLQMCNQALAHEQSRRKFLEIQWSESKARYENVVAEYQGAQSMIEKLTAKRDEEIATFRDSLATKEATLKEMEFVRAHLQQENQELLGSLREFQEAQINQVGAVSSVSKLRQKLRSLEHVHRECSAILKAKEEEWSSKIEKMEMELNECQFELSSKNKQIKDLQMEIEGCHSSMMQLKAENEEIFMTLMVMKSEFSQAHSEQKSEAEMKLYGENKVKQISTLMEELEKKNHALLEALAGIEREHEVKASLMRVESSDCIEQQLHLVHNELHRFKELLQESSQCQDRLKGQASNMESALREDLRKVLDALDKANLNLAEKGKIVDDLQQRILLLEEESVRREAEAAIFAKLEAEKTFSKEKDAYLRMAAEKDEGLNDLCKKIMSLEQEFTKSVESKQSEISTLYGAWEKIAADCILSELEIQEQNHFIAEQEEEIDGLKQELQMKERSFSESKKWLEQLKVELVMKQLEKEREAVQCHEKLRSMESTVQILESQVEQLKMEMTELLDVNARLALEKDKLVSQMMGFCNQLDDFSRKDAKLMSGLERIAQLAENDDYLTEDKDIRSCSEKKVEVSTVGRLPLKVLNS